MGKEGELLYVVYGYDGGAGMLHKYDIKKRKDNEVMELDGYIIAADNRKCCITKAAPGVSHPQAISRNPERACSIPPTCR